VKQEAERRIDHGPRQVRAAGGTEELNVRYDPATREEVVAQRQPEAAEERVDRIGVALVVRFKADLQRAEPGPEANTGPNETSRPFALMTTTAGLTLRHMSPTVRGDCRWRGEDCSGAEQDESP
jgi:hypothetical protein